MKNRLHGAFDQIKADDALLKCTMDYLHGEIAKRENRRLRLSNKFAALSACMAAVLLLFGAFFYRFYSSAQTYVSIDVNPSIELALNGFDRVIAAQSYNNDGELLLNSVDIQGEKYDAALAALLTQMGHDGHITADALISVTVQTARVEKESALCQALRYTVESMLTKNPNTDDTPTDNPHIEVFPVTREIWSNAHGCHMTPARYIAIQELMEVDEAATLEQYSDSTIGQIRQRTQQCRDAHMRRGNTGGSPGNENSGRGGGHGHGHGHHGRPER